MEGCESAHNSAAGSFIFLEVKGKQNKIATPSDLTYEKAIANVLVIHWIRTRISLHSQYTGSTLMQMSNNI